MSCDAGTFLNLLFHELEAGGIVPAGLHPREEPGSADPVAIRFSVSEANLPRLRKIQVKLARENGWALVRSWHGRDGGLNTVLVNLNHSAGYLRLRACPLPGRNGLSAIREWQRQMKNALQPGGLCLAVLGSDGAGKSTLLERLQTLLQPCFPEQRTFHFRPAVLERKKTGVVTDPHGSTSRSGIASWLKVGYYLADHWLGWLLLVRPWKLAGALVIFDRSFDDLLVDQRRYRLQKTSRLARVLRGFAPGIDRTLVLSAPAEILHQRKPELPLPELARQQRVLRELATAGRRYQFISAEPAREEVAQAAWRDVVTFLAAREEQRA